MVCRVPTALCPCSSKIENCAAALAMRPLTGPMALAVPCTLAM
jgi:hypothetical protein